jgi:hypothetical protein
MSSHTQYRTGWHDDDICVECTKYKNMSSSIAPECHVLWVSEEHTWILLRDLRDTRSDMLELLTTATEFAAEQLIPIKNLLGKGWDAVDFGHTPLVLLHNAKTKREAETFILSRRSTTVAMLRADMLKLRESAESVTDLRPGA